MTDQLPTITVVGSSNSDLVVKVRRLPQPGETVIGGNLVAAGGGKGANQAVAARRLGAEVYFVARVGADLFGEQALAAYRAEGMHTDYLAQTPNVPSGVALIVVDDHGENQIAVAPGANAHLTPRDVEAATAPIAASTVVVLQLEVPLETVRATIRAAKRAGKTILLNPAPAPHEGLPAELLGEVDVLNPNRHEASALTGISVDDARSAEEAGRLLLRHGVGSVVMTLGKEGALLITTDGTRLIPAYAVDVADTTGAGDAFTAGLAVALAEGQSVDAAARMANACGALATTRLGAQPSMPSRSEVERLLAR